VFGSRRHDDRPLRAQHDFFGVRITRATPIPRHVYSSYFSFLSRQLVTIDRTTLQRLDVQLDRMKMLIPRTIDDVEGRR
jgi:hypothetical protein